MLFGLWHRGDLAVLFWIFLCSRVTIEDEEQVAHLRTESQLVKKHQQVLLQSIIKFHALSFSAIIFQQKQSISGKIHRYCFDELSKSIQNLAKVQNCGL